MQDLVLYFAFPLVSWDVDILKWSEDHNDYNGCLQCCLSVGVRTPWTVWGRQYPGSQVWTTPFSPLSHRQASTVREKYSVGSMLTRRLTARAIMSVSRTPRTPVSSTPWVSSVLTGRFSSRRSSHASGGEYVGSGSSCHLQCQSCQQFLLK